jgi:galactokinase
LIHLFKQTYHSSPKLIARSPGRVNLIGEHIDYSGYSVLPMAIERDTIMAVDWTKEGKTTTVSLINSNPKYPKREFDWKQDGGHVDIDSSIHECTQ